MMKPLQGALLVLIAASASAGPSNDEMARCAAIQAPDSRLSCYDALAHRPADRSASTAGAAAGLSPAAPASTAPTSAAAKSAASTPAAPVPAAPVAAAAAPVGQTPATVASIAADPQNFGLTPAQTHTAELGPKSEKAHVSIVSSDQVGRTYVVLDSGQTWIVLDPDGRLSSGDAVTIRRAALGSFLMLTPSNHSYRVRRLK